jgi:hypothetical protein
MRFIFKVFHFFEVNAPRTCPKGQREALNSHQNHPGRSGPQIFTNAVPKTLI